MPIRRRWVELSEDRIYLSKASSTAADALAVSDAVAGGWLSPSGPALQAFEDELAEFVGVGGAVGLASGTAALHLGLKYLGVSPGDFVLVPTVTFGATAFAVTYLGAKPILVDIDESWNMDPGLIERGVATAKSLGGRVTAAIPVDLYGTPADMKTIGSECERFGISILEDAAEALGATNGDGRVGAGFSPAAFSFNGNKIMTTSSGGALVSNDLELLDKVRYWATQAREPVAWYEHQEIGFNYRLSNVLAALGLSQLERLPVEVLRRRDIRNVYRSRLGGIPGVSVQEDPSWGLSNAWLSVVTFDSAIYPDVALEVMKVLEANDIESRPTWKPMHSQPVFSTSPAVITGRADRLFAEGLCLPSGDDVTPQVVGRIADVIVEYLGLT